MCLILGFNSYLELNLSEQLNVKLAFTVIQMGGGMVPKLPEDPSLLGVLRDCPNHQVQNTLQPTC